MGFLDASRGLSFSEWLDFRKKVSKSMTSEPMRDPLTDPLPTPANSALVVIDYQPNQIQTVPELAEVLTDHVEIDRTQINAWEDVEFRQTVEATGRNKLIMTALWTEVSLAFPSLDALRDGYEVYPVADAVGRDLSGGASSRP